MEHTNLISEIHYEIKRLAENSNTVIEKMPANLKKQSMMKI